MAVACDIANCNANLWVPELLSPRKCVATNTEQHAHRRRAMAKQNISDIELYC